MSDQWCTLRTGQLAALDVITSCTRPMSLDTQTTLSLLRALRDNDSIACEKRVPDGLANTSSSQLRGLRQ